MKDHIVLLNKNRIIFIYITVCSAFLLYSRSKMTLYYYFKVCRKTHKQPVLHRHNIKTNCRNEAERSSKFTAVFWYVTSVKFDIFHHILNQNDYLNSLTVPFYYFNRDFAV